MAAGTLQSVDNLLKDSLSLEKVRDSKEQLVKQKSTIEYQLQKESDKYYSQVEESLQKLRLSQKSVRIIKEKLSDVHKLGLDSSSSINRYEVIYNATELYKTIDMTSSIYDRIVQFNSAVSDANRLLDEELMRDVLDSGYPNLLQIHYLVTKIRDFQDQMIIMAQVSSHDVQRTVQKLFSGVHELVSKLDKTFTSVIYDLVEMVRADQVSLIIRFFKVMELEEREDLKVMAIKNVIKKKEIEQEKTAVKKLSDNKSNLLRQQQQERIAHANTVDIHYPTNEGIYAEILNRTIQTRTDIRGYKNFFFNTLAQSIRDMFVEVRNTYQGEKKFEVLANMDWVFNELVLVKEHLSKYCPPYWKLFERYFDIYYEELHALITELIQSEPETLIILDIIDFDRSFQATLVKDFGFTKKEAKSVIGDKQKEGLFDDYLNLIVTKMTEWLDNLMKAEFEVFEERATPPHVDSEGLLFLDGTKTCFQMFTQQVEVAAGSSQAKILVGVIEKFSGLLAKRQTAWLEKIQLEVRKLLDYNKLDAEQLDAIPADKDCPGGLVEYLTALANDQMRAADYAVGISSKYGKIVSKVYERAIINHIDNTLDGFAEVARYCALGLISIMFDDLKKPYEEIFSKSWYSGSHAQQIVGTLYEYLMEIKSQMNPFVFSTLLDNVVEQTILKFIKALQFEHSFKNKNNKFLECVKRDFELFYKLFIQFVPEGEDKTLIIDDKFKLMEFFMDFTCGPSEDITSMWQKCLDVYWDVPVDMLRAILNSRKDVDNSHRKRIMQEAIEMSENRQRNRHEDEQPTFISKLVLEKDAGSH